MTMTTIESLNLVLQKALHSTSDTEATGVQSACKAVVAAMPCLTSSQQTISNRNIDNWIAAILNHEAFPEWELESEPL